MTWADLIEGTTVTPIYEVALRLVLAAVFGAIIGLEREVKARPAGLRTHMLTALAAAVFTVLAFEIFHQVRQLEQPVTADPVRVIEAVTAGVAFLAAGTIITSQGQVHGLTTGAGMWLAGSVGLACGGGYYLVAFIALILAVAILTVIRMIESRLPSKDT
jgi:putative Mg2+ transporter-C (MgtC) family protein